MKVVLIDEVPSLGIPGDVKEVKDGYARNYLIPQKLAVLATAQELARAESRKKVELERRVKLNKEMGVVAERLTAEPLLMPVRVGPGGRLYGSVTATEIAAALTEKTGVEVDRRAVDLPQPIREQGIHQVRVRLAPDVIPTVAVTVYPEGGTPPTMMEEAAAAEETAAEEEAAAEEAEEPGESEDETEEQAGA
jgi:large subunit ribosomal protein L9